MNSDKELIDINENDLYQLDQDLLSILLFDHTSNKNIIWGTNDYSKYGIGYQFEDQITIYSITNTNSNVIKPRVAKSFQEQVERSRRTAEVFTPSWICNKQNNLIDTAWFNSRKVFNNEKDVTWTSNNAKVSFPSDNSKTWQDYVKQTCLEITCGEAPYLVSRYDTVTGELIPLSQRIGLLDRKMRIVKENSETNEQWLDWSKTAVKNVFGFDFQGDNVLLARENILLSYIDYYNEFFGNQPSVELLKEIAEIVSWNIWQMDGMKYVIPRSCSSAEDKQISLFDEPPKKMCCEGCKTNDPFKHVGMYSKIMDWETGKTIKFVSLLQGSKEGKRR